MKQRLLRGFSFLLFPLIALAIGWLSSDLTRYGMTTVYPTLHKPALTPPDFVFPIAWGILFVLMGIGMAMVWNRGHYKAAPALLFWLLQLAFNFAWVLLFFGQNNHLCALICLVVLFILVLLMALQFRSINIAAARLQIPYLLWLLFAGYLNGAIWILNR